MTVFTCIHWLRSISIIFIVVVGSIIGGWEGDRQALAWEAPYVQMPHPFAEPWRNLGAARAAGTARTSGSACSMPKNQYVQRDWDDDVSRLPLGNSEFNATLSADYLERGNACLRQGSKLEAIVAYSYAIQFNPQSTSAHANRGTAYALWQRYGQATNDYTRALQLDPNEAELYVMRAHVYGLSGKRDLALSDYNQALRVDRTNAIVYHYRGLSYATSGRYDLAIQDYERALSIDPTLSDTCRAMSNAYRQVQQPDRARSIWDQCLPATANSVGAVASANGAIVVQVAPFKFPIRE